MRCRNQYWSRVVENGPGQRPARAVTPEWFNFIVPVAVRFRLYPEPSAVAVMVRHNADARFVWNLALEQANTYRRQHGPTPNSAVRMRQLAQTFQ